MDGYLRAASQISRLAVGDRNAVGVVGDLQDSARGVADAPRRRRADGHARRHVGRAHVSRPTATTCFKASLHYEPLGGLAGRNSMTALRPQGAGRVLGQRRARRAARSQHAHERDRSEEQPRARDAAGPHQGRPAARHRGVRPEARRPGRRPADAAREHAGRRQHHAWASRCCRTCATSIVRARSTSPACRTRRAA